MLTREEWLKLLNRFAIDVANKLYKKCDYSKWKLISKPVSNYCSIDLDNNSNICVMTGAHNPVYFKSNDNSLGEFLFKNVLTILATIVGMAFIMFIGVLFSSLIGKMISFVSGIISELSYRV